MTAHIYKAKLTWTGNLGEGTSGYKAYTRDYDVAFEGKPVIKGSSDPNYFGDATRHNPEDMLLAALSACHMLWYLHLCAVNRIVVTDYEDHAEGVMEMSRDGSGQFTEVMVSSEISRNSRCLKAHPPPEAAAVFRFATPERSVLWTLLFDTRFETADE